MGHRCRPVRSRAGGRAGADAARLAAFALQPEGVAAQPGIRGHRRSGLRMAAEAQPGGVTRGLRLSAAYRKRVAKALVALGIDATLPQARRLTLFGEARR